MIKESAPLNIDKEYAFFQYEGFNWRYRKILNRNGQIDFEYWGPLCVRKKCLSNMTDQNNGQYQCINCAYKNQTNTDSSILNQKIHSKMMGEWTKGLKFSNYDKLQAINEKLEEKNKFYKIAVEHDNEGNLNDVHILIGRKNNKGNKAHIIISVDGEIRFDKKDLHPSDEIKAITSIIFK